MLLSPFETLQRKSFVYRGEDAAEKFIECLHEEHSRFEKIFDKIAPMNFDRNDELVFKSSVICHLCQKALNWDSDDDPVVRDHCHISGKFRGASHSSCNLNAKQQKRLIVFYITVEVMIIIL